MAEIAPADDKEAQDFKAANPAPGAAPPPGAAAPATEAMPGSPAALEGEKSEAVGGTEQTQATTGAGEGTQQENAGDAPPEPERKTITFNVGGSTVSISDDGTNAQLTAPPTKLFSSIKAEGSHGFNFSIPVGGFGLSVGGGVSLSYLFHIADGMISGATVSKAGSVYTISGNLNTSLHVGFGVGAQANISAGVWILSAGAGLSGTASVGGRAPISSAFSIRYDGGSKQMSAAASIATSEFLMPILAQLSVFVWLVNLKKAWPVASAKLGALKVGASKASWAFGTGQSDGFSGQPPSFSYDKNGADGAFFNG